MSSPVKIAQLSDCHIPEDPQTPYRDTDARATLEQLKPLIAEFDPDLILLTGDLSEDASEASYEWLARSLQEFGVAIAAIPGNHDNSRRLAEFFPNSAAVDPLFVELDDWQLLLLDSTIPREVPGRIEPAELERVEQRLRSDSRPALVALHHQPVEVGSPWIDKYALLDPAPFWQVIEQFPHVKAVIWGHIHQVFEQQRGGVQLLGTPSTVSNSLTGRQKFAPDGAGPAARWFELLPDGEFRTGIISDSES